MQIIITDYSSHERDIRRVRDQVFLIEQKIDPKEEFDDRDLECAHAIVYDTDAPIATGRIDLAKGGKVGRVAVLREHRQRGAGTMIMRAFENYAAERGLEKIWFHAQTSAMEFYRKLGYSECGDIFEEAKIPHVRMEKTVFMRRKDE